MTSIFRVVSVLLFFSLSTIAVGQETPAPTPQTPEVKKVSEVSNAGEGDFAKLIQILNEISISSVEMSRKTIESYNLANEICDFEDDIPSKSEICFKFLSNIKRNVEQESIYNNNSLLAGNLLGRLTSLEIEKQDIRDNSINSENSWAESHNKEVFRSHHEKSNFIFYFVISLCSIGILFSSIHFFIDIKRQLLSLKTGGVANKIQQNYNGTEDNTRDSQEQHKAKFGLSGIELGSSAVGIVIFFITIAFFYLYIAHVYPIK